MAVELYANGLSAGYTDGFHIRELDLSIPSGKITSLIGANGSGKSTILKALTRLIPKDQGNLYLDGQSIYQIPTKEIARKLAILPQNAQCPDALTVEELVENGRYPHRRRFGGLTAEDREVVYWAMKACGVLDFAHREVDSLSGGQRQRVWIAMALAQKTDMLFLDEPTTFLDIAHQLDIMQLLVQLNREQGVTIVMVIHDLNHAAMFSDYVVAVRNGIKEFEGTPQQVITPEVLRIVFDVESVPFSHPVFHTQLCLPYDLCRHPSKDTFYRKLRLEAKVAFGRRSRYANILCTS